MVGDGVWIAYTQPAQGIIRLQHALASGQRCVNLLQYCVKNREVIGISSACYPRLLALYLLDKSDFTAFIRISSEVLTGLAQ